MRIGLIDLDNINDLKHCFPNIPLMKISAWHKKQGDSVEWYYPLLGHFDKVYISKVFSFTDEYPYFIDAGEVERGGSGYAIKLIDGKEVYQSENDKPLPYEIEHIYPDYSLYGITDTAYGSTSKGCPRKCDFCHVKSMHLQGTIAHKVADLSEFWNGQKYIQLCDPNVLACVDWKDILQQLIDSKAYVDFNQGLDIRLMTDEKAEMLKQIKIKKVHFAFDRFQDWDLITPRLETFMNTTGWNRDRVSCYVLCNFDTTLDQDLKRIYFLREHKIQPYVMLYNKENIPKGHVMRKLQRWVNSPQIFWKIEKFEDYNR